MVRGRMPPIMPAAELRELADRIESREGAVLRLTKTSTRRAVAALRFYADAVEQPRNDQSMYQVEICSAHDHILETMAVTQNAIVGIAAFEATKEVRPTCSITLRKGMHLLRGDKPGPCVEDSPGKK